MTRVRVKICGVRSYEEAILAVELGADALGFNFWTGSRRYIRPQEAGEIITRLPPFACCVGVFVNSDAHEIRQTAGTVRLDAIQLHGDETPEFCAEFGSIKTIKAIRIRDGFEPRLLKEYPVSAILLDTGVSGHYGGTGVTFNWELAARAKEFAPIILAGGLTPENVGDAITTVQPMAVDVCSGVEAEPGRKDFARLKRFLEEVSRTNASL